MSIEQLVNLVSQLGFPVVVAGYLLYHHVKNYNRMAEHMIDVLAKRKLNPGDTHK